MPSLIDLPTELLDLVASNFDLLDARKPLLQKTAFPIFEAGPKHRRSDRSSLSALSATCRHLRTRIQPILYHVAYPYHAQVEFARTLKSRPDLAAVVRQLYYADGAYSDRKGRPFFPSVNKHTLDYTCAVSNVGKPSPTNFNDLIAQQPEGPFWEGMHENEDGSITCTAGRPSVGDHLDTLSGKQWRLENTLLIRILQLVPNLQSLSLWYLLTERAVILPIGILHNLQEFRLYSRDPSDPEYQCSIYSLDKRMPALRRLEYHFVQGFPDEEHGNVTELILSNCMLFQEDFSTIARGFANLRKLSYTLSVLNGIDCASSRGIFEALLPRLDTLTELTVRINGDIMKGQVYRPGDDFWELPDHIDGRRFDPMCLSRFHKLEYLGLDADALEDLLKGGFGNSFSRGLLAKLLPSSLQRVEFYLGSALEDIIDTISHWASFCRQNVTSLKAVALTNHARIEDRMRDLVKTFESAGVACSNSQHVSDEEALLLNHRLGPQSQLESYDDWPGWPFWDPEAEPMPLVPMAYYPGASLQRLAESLPE